MTELMPAATGPSADELGRIHARLESDFMRLAEQVGDPESQEAARAADAQYLLQQTALALARIEAGTFGTCEVCGEPIALTQLSAFPRSTTCVTCRPRTPAPA